MATPAQDPQNAPDAGAELNALRAELAALRQAHAGLLHAVSHDLRAPLRHISSFAPLLREAVQALQAGDLAAGAEAEEFLQPMEQGARRLARMIDALLLLSRTASGPLQPAPIDLVAQAQALAAQLAAPGALVQWQWPAAPVLLQADAAQLHQLLQALLENALKFSQGRAPAQIALRAEPLAGGGWRWSVQDNGAGFDPARAQGLFGLFQRLHRESEFEGLGVGLALAQAIAQRHGARITAQAQPGAGCTISLDWPAHVSHVQE